MSAMLDTRGKTNSGHGDIDMVPESEGKVSRFLHTNRNLPSPTSRIGDLGAGWKGPIMRAADSRWGLIIVFEIHMKAISSFVLNVDG